MVNLSPAPARDRAHRSLRLRLSRHSCWFIFLHYAQLSSVHSLSRHVIPRLLSSRTIRSFFVSKLMISWSRTLTHATCWAGMLDRGSPTGWHRIINALRSLEEQQLWLTFHADIRSFYIYTLNIYTLISICIQTHTCSIYFWIACWSKSATWF